MSLDKLFWWVTLGATLLLPQLALADISGQVFRDFNANGTFDTGADFNEVGVANVTAKAFDSAGVQVAVTTSASDGSYTLTGLSSGAAYRIEFSWGEAWFKPGAAGGTSVQFAQDGATHINMALNNPADYSPSPQSGIEIAVPVAIVGPTDQLIAAGRDYRSFGALVKFPSTANGAPGDVGYIAPTTIATHGQIGSTSGAAYHRESKSLFVAAYAKRAVGFGPGGPGAIYRVAQDGTVSVQATIPDAGSDLHDFSGDFTQINYDIAFAPNVGKSSLGDMEISADGQTLYVVNLHNRHLYAVSTQNANTVNDLGIITRPSSCPDEDFRPFGLGLDESNALYIGTICSNQSRTSAGPTATILKYEGASVYTEVLNFSLSISGDFWWSWSDTMITGYNSSETNSRQQPLLTDVVFDGKDMTLAFRNRQWDASYVPAGTSPSMGHVLKACWQGSAWSLENNGECGGQTGALPNYSNTTSAGPGGGYFFDMVDFLSVVNALGSGAILPGSTMVATLSDPFAAYSCGVRQLNPKTGVANTNYQVFKGNFEGSPAVGDPGYFGKTSGLGDLEFLLDPAPIEIGNRVWLDANSNGIQDAGEEGLSNITVELLLNGSVIATATTASDGSYFFTNAAGTSTVSKIYGLAQLQPNTDYIVKFPTNVTSASVDYTLTTATAGSNVLIDSNAATSGEVLVAAADIPTAGANNHSFDVGYAANPPSADLSLSKSVDKSSVKKGETIRYTLTVTNDGPDTTTGVEVIDQLPASLTYTAHTASQGTYTLANGIWSVGTLANGASATLTIDATVD